MITASIPMVLQPTLGQLHVQTLSNDDSDTARSMILASFTFYLSPLVFIHFFLPSVL